MDAMAAARPAIQRGMTADLPSPAEADFSRAGNRR
jgi:hypothetical protein